MEDKRVEITELKIDLKGRELIMTLEEAEELYAVLGKLFGSKGGVEKEYHHTYPASAPPLYPPIIYYYTEPKFPYGDYHTEWCVDNNQILCISRGILNE
uniref:Uncharacterized protein n=1 Tax=viral metagenome TaxID=1070528 RepID=A0A6M3L3L3_9ZZZZ